MHAEATSDHQVSLVGPLLGLTLVTGLIDAVSFLGLGHVFTANMTGNVVFLGFALGGAAILSVSRSLAALAAFGAGGVFGGRLNNGVARTPVRHLPDCLVCRGGRARRRRSVGESCGPQPVARHRVHW